MKKKKIMSVKRMNLGEGEIGICPEHNGKIMHVDTYNEEFDKYGVWVHKFFCIKCDIFYEWESEFKHF